ncbi:right-handed parallel beta-helix repeat-containing protein, partial [bacterium]|nr:right-handed parallel beta-helix repeat-containing protein [bacterium]
MHTFSRTTAPSRIIRCAVPLLAGLILVTATPALADWVADDTFINSRTPEERANLFGFKQSPDFEREYAERLRTLDEKQELPEFFSWATQGGLTIAKDQGGCGSCWAFAGIGQIEAHMKIFYGQELDLSEQQTIDCNPYGADCDGGWASAVYNVAMTYGLTREAALPYNASSTAPCTQSAYLPFAFVDSWYYVSTTVTQIKTALLDGPVCSSMDADEPFPSYTEGCYNEPGGPWTNHLVLIVGWDDRGCGGTGAWICKNSWGTDFGDGGLFSIGFGASLIGTNVTQIQLVVPPVDVVLLGPDPEVDYFAEESLEIEWLTTDAPCDYVDIWVGEHGVFDTRIAESTPNDGSFMWTIPNVTTDQLRICVVADGDTRNGFDISDYYTVIGHKTVYVSALGSNTPPYISPATAAHTITDAVTACTGRDTILVATGDYTGTVGISGSVWVIGGWDDSFVSRDSQANPTRIQSPASGMVFSYSPAGYSGVVGLEFHDCIGLMGSMPALGRHGGGIYCSNSSPLIKDCVFIDDSADPFGGYGVGGAIVVYGGSPRIEGCTFTGSLADQGGAVAMFAPVAAEISDSEFLANDCTESASGQEGAALYVLGGSATLSGNHFEGNDTTFHGGAVYAENADLTLSDNDFVGNQAEARGGAVAIQGGSLLVQGGSFVGNASVTTMGGGVHAFGADVVMRNVLVSGNVGPSLGAGVFLDSTGAVELENCAFVDNVSSAANMGAVGILIGDSFLFRNNVVADNQGGGIGGVVTTLNLDYNLIWNNGVDYLLFTPGIHDISVEPLYVDAGGGDYGLALHSPGLDRGDPDAACNDVDASRNDMGVCGGP